jgi:hypothetical protein
MNSIFLNLVLVFTIMVGVVLDPSIGGTHIDIHNMKIIWKLIDFIIISISFYFVFIQKKVLYVLTLFASSCMIFKTYSYNHQHCSNQHLQQLKVGSLVDGLILGIAMSSIYYITH